MESNDGVSFKVKFHILMISIILTIAVVLLMIFGFDKMEVGEIIICVLVSIYAFTIILAFARYAYTYKLWDIEESKWYFYCRWIFLAIMIAPIYGPGFYFKPKREIY
jgi:purine-cytosine permease-like protein